MEFVRKYAVVLAGSLFLIIVAAFLYMGAQAPASQRLVAVQPEGNLPGKRILFVGNSYTFFNDMPLMVQNMLNTGSNRRFNYQVDLIAKGGASLTDHMNGGAVLPRIKAGRYDYVFLQEQSTTAFYTDKAPLSEAAFGVLIRAAKEQGARIALISTWGRKPGNEFYSGASYSNIARPADVIAMSRRLNDFYRRVASRYGVDYIPVGAYWLVVLQKNPEIELYVKDGSHPTPAGSYLMALMTYRYIAGAVAQDTWRAPGLSEAESSLLLRLVSSSR